MTESVHGRSCPNCPHQRPALRAVALLRLLRQHGDGAWGPMPADFTPSPLATIQARSSGPWRRKAAMYDVPERPVEIGGPDAVRFMERIFARRVGTLKEGRGRYAIACAPNGGVFMDGILFKLSEDRFWYVQPDGALETWLIAHSEGFDVTISDPKSRVIQIQGPKSLEIMHAASNGAIDEKMGYFPRRLLRSGRSGALCFPDWLDRRARLRDLQPGSQYRSPAPVGPSGRGRHAPTAWSSAAPRPWRSAASKPEFWTTAAIWTCR